MPELPACEYPVEMDTLPDTPLGPLGDDSINVLPDVPSLLKPLGTGTRVMLTSASPILATRNRLPCCHDSEYGSGLPSRVIAAIFPASSFMARKVSS